MLQPVLGGFSENQDLDNHNHLVPDQPQPNHNGWVVLGWVELSCTFFWVVQPNF